MEFKTVTGQMQTLIMGVVVVVVLIQIKTAALLGLLQED